MNTEKTGGPGGNNSTAHTNLVREILNELGARADCIVWQARAGTYRFIHSDGVVCIDPVGIPDIVGITHGGRWILIEVKTGTGRLSKSQEAFRRNIEALGATVCVARSTQDAVTYMDSINPKKAA